MEHDSALPPPQTNIWTTGGGAAASACRWRASAVTHISISLALMLFVNHPACRPTSHALSLLSEVSTTLIRLRCVCLHYSWRRDESKSFFCLGAVCRAQPPPRISSLCFLSSHLQREMERNGQLSLCGHFG